MKIRLENIDSRPRGNLRFQICMFSHDSLKTTHMYTFEDNKRIFISESGIEQVLKRTEIVIRQSNTFDF